MTRSSSVLVLRGGLVATMVVALFAIGASSASAVIFTWVPTSGTGDWTDASNWNPNTAYPSQSGTDSAFITGTWVGDVTVNLTASLATDNIRIGNLAAASGSTLYPGIISTTNGSTLRMVHLTNPSGTSVLNIAGGNNPGNTNLITPDLLIDAATFETRSTISSGAGINAQVNCAITGNVSGATAGNKIIRYTNSSSSTGGGTLDFRGNITNGVAAAVSIFYRNDMANGINTLKLSGTGNTFTGGVTFQGGASLSRSIFEASPASGAGGVLSTGLFQLGTGASSATLNMGGSLSTVTEVCGINVAATGTAARRIAVIGAGSRILSGTLNNVSGTSGLTLACTNSGNLTLSNLISGTAALAINSTGSGKVIFSGNNTYTGPTTVTAGAFQLDGSLSGSSILSVASAGILAGSGTASGAATISGGTLSPGSTTGVLSLGSLTLTATSTALIDLLAAGTRGTDYDGLTILNAGGLTYGGTMSFAFGGSAVPDNTTFSVFSFTGSPSGSFGQVSSTGFYAGTWTDNADGTFSLASGGQTLTFSQATGNVLVVPEPATIALAGIGVVFAVAAARRRAFMKGYRS
jgi:autotransporter-associated beta strand protein